MLPKLALASLLAVAALGGLTALSAQPPSSTPAQPATSAPSKEALSAETTLSQLEFLAGRWKDTQDDSLVEEHWSAPHGTSIMGMFRWCNPSGQPAMFEILTITKENDDIRLRLRHYSAKLVAKEDKDAPQTLKLASIAPNKAVFAAEANCGSLAKVTYERTSDNRLKIEVAFTPEADRPALNFDLARE